MDPRRANYKLCSGEGQREHPIVSSPGRQDGGGVFVVLEAKAAGWRRLPAWSQGAGWDSGAEWRAGGGAASGLTRSGGLVVFATEWWRFFRETRVPVNRRGGRRLIRFAERQRRNTTGSRIMFDHIKNEGFCKREIKVDQISLGNLVKMKIYYGL
jgi:hypothetical protein